MSRRIRTRKQRTKKRNEKVILINLGILLFFLLFVSVIFSLLNMGNNKIARGVKIGTVNVSNLTQEEAKQKVEKWYQEVVLSNISVVYEELQESISLEQLDISFDIDKAIRQASLVGKSGNVLKDNYELFFSLLFSKKIEAPIKLNQEKIEELNTKLPNAMKQSNYYIEEDNLIITKGKSGVQIKAQEFQKSLEKIMLQQEERQFVIPVEQIEPEEIDLTKIHNEIYKEAKDAYLTKSPLEIHPHVNGIDFAISLEEANAILQEDKEEYSIPLHITVPQITTEKLGQEAFPNLLGNFSTTYSTSNINRVTNLELASEKINGTIILPGETFSYNKIVGERTIAKGYKEAAVYSGGKVVDGIGGGICQLSSTLYNAVIYANLEIIQRSNHRFLTSYVTAGRDATVSWGTIDFCFKNTRKYPIKIVTSVKNGVVTTQIYGLREEKEYEISIENTVTEVIPYSINYVKDYSLPQGTEEIKQYGSNGAKSVTYKVEKYNGVVISKTLLSTDTYSPLERIIVQGAKKEKSVNASVEEKQEESNMNQLNPDLLEAIKEL